MPSDHQRLYHNPILQAVVLVLFFMGAYFVPFSSLFNTWMTSDDYSYGLLIPFISLYLLWDKKQRIGGASIQSFWPIFPVLLFFILVSVYGVLGSSGHISRPALPILIILFAIFNFGMDVFKRIRLPLFFLVFMIPLPTVLDRTIGVFLKRVSSELGGMFIRACGYSVYVSGNIIDLGVIKLQVIDACSGLRFLFPLLALGVLYGYFFEKSTWKRVACVLVTIPIAILTNVLRIGITGLLTYNFGNKMAEGFFHDFQGMAIFMTAFVFLFMFGRFLRFFPSKNSEIKNFQQNEPLTNSPGVLNRGNLDAFIVSILMLAGLSVLTMNVSALPPVMIRGGIGAFPLAFNDWRGRSQNIDSEIIKASGAEEAFSSIYRNENGQTISLYMGYRSTAFLENRNFFHSPTVCLPSSGWKILGKSKRIIHKVPMFKDLGVTEMIMEAEGEKRLVYFWFQTKTRATHDKNINRFHLAIHAIKKDNTHDLFIRPITNVGKEETLEDARNRMDEFVREMMATLVNFLEKHLYEASLEMESSQIY